MANHVPKDFLKSPQEIQKWKQTVKKCLKRKGLRSRLKSQKEYDRIENVCKTKIK